ncbi:hypothetical protein NtRootA4_32110 [Arthrobacter sp. NtRootA4]|nr:hypothetical protein NtRootA2_34310 [Arthrobacter sp. NtRootA2]BCW16232.1 hypothetical protein NtRootA4_32110 [Arthrobacter sp. NtRootA4]BCW24564.1 hypothetical protein NtRootC7_34310 [Arthrobacter sp. NtRootC7]BCW28834.1 hypothetical protein NtRootC45_34340 [Arthrobacter sp. NtRootC45]BCW33104.1 hypothetical protein NtRootD5_34350 [Arthrobacter sp. NtRootD5]
MALTADLVVGLRKQMDTATDETVYKRDESWTEMTRLVGVFRVHAKAYIEAVRDDLETGSNDVGPPEGLEPK